MDNDRRWRLVREERQDLLLFFRALTQEQWERPSLCAGWRIRDVAAHLLVDEPVESGAVKRILPMLVKERFSIDRVNARWVELNRRREMDSIVAQFEDDSRRRIGLFGRLVGPAVALRALVIHHQDMRRALNLNRVIPTDRLLTVLDVMLTWKGSISIGSVRRAAGLHLHAVDVDWSQGDGADLRGPGEAIVMALAGRQAALADLDGGGKTILAARMPSN